MFRHHIQFEEGKDKIEFKLKLDLVDLIKLADDIESDI
jgi:hypothetical protein